MKLFSILGRIFCRQKNESDRFTTEFRKWCEEELDRKNKEVENARRLAR
jgi:hypothetical protein